MEVLDLVSISISLSHFDLDLQVLNDHSKMKSVDLYGHIVEKKESID
jgi:hypothetical protein